MRTQTYSGNLTNYIPSLAASGHAEMGLTRQDQDKDNDEGDFFVPAAPRKMTPAGLVGRIDWLAVGAGAFVYAVAFAAWVWLAR